MEEILELKELLIQGQLEDALILVEDLEEMGNKGISNNIRSYSKVLLLHLIKQQVENRTTKSWDASIENASAEIRYLNQRPKGKGNYLNSEELFEVITSAWKTAVNHASTEASEGIYEAKQIEQMVDKLAIINRACFLVLDQE